MRPRGCLGDENQRSKENDARRVSHSLTTHIISVSGVRDPVQYQHVCSIHRLRKLRGDARVDSFTGKQDSRSTALHIDAPPPTPTWSRRGHMSTFCTAAGRRLCMRCRSIVRKSTPVPGKTLPCTTARSSATKVIQNEKKSREKSTDAKQAHESCVLIVLSINQFIHSSVGVDPSPIP
jgi:hypothetical protein